MRVDLTSIETAWTWRLSGAGVVGKRTWNKLTHRKMGDTYDRGHSHQEDSVSAKMDNYVQPRESSRYKDKEDGTPRNAPTAACPWATALRYCLVKLLRLPIPPIIGAPMATPAV